MARCELCGNAENETIEIIKRGKTHVFDSFECAIQSLAPVCSFCGVKIIGHGLLEKNLLYCSAHCAREGVENELEDRALAADTMPT